MSAFTLVRDIVHHPANRKRRTASLLRAVRWQVFKRLTGRPYDLSYHGMILRCHPSSHSASRALYFSSLPDYREMRFMLDFLRPGDRFIDAGANVGLYTLLALSVVGDSGYVHAFEPNATVAAMLRETVNLNGSTNVTVHEIGLADEQGEAAFCLEGEDCTAHIVSTSHGNQSEIPIGRLDHILENVPFALMKLDIEGYEPFAIKGASAWTRNHNPPVMLIEMAGYSSRHGVSTSDFIRSLAEMGYFTAVYDPNLRRLIRTNKPWEVPAENVLAVSCEREDFVLQRLRGNAV